MMGHAVLVRTMRAEDIDAVLTIQSRCYDDTKLESAQSFLAKLNASPTSCFMALTADQPAGYLVAIPVEAGSPLPLNGSTCLVPPTANALYLHDLAVHPDARGAGVSAALVEAYFRAVNLMGVAFACLTSVNDSSGFWARHGFQAAVPTGPAAHALRTYGEGAQYMTMRWRRTEARPAGADT